MSSGRGLVDEGGQGSGGLRVYGGLESRGQGVGGVRGVELPRDRDWEVWALW